MTRQSKVYLFLSILSALTWVLDEYFSGNELLQQQVTERYPDYFGTGYTKIEMNDQGQPQYMLYADKVTHFSDNKTTEMEKPVLTYYKTEKPPWVIHSETGSMTEGEDLLFLNGKVTVNRDRAPGVRKVILNTSNARVRTKESYAETDEWAELIMPPDKISGTGAKIYFADPIHIELLADVRGRYDAK